MLSIDIPVCFFSERKYVIDILFNEILGIPFQLQSTNLNDDYKITLPNNTSVLIKDCFFSSCKDTGEYLKPDYLPNTVTFFETTFAPEENIPILFGTDQISANSNQIICEFDIFAACFFMLSRLEEVIIKSRDNHDRFSAKDSLAYKANFLNRPIVDEYAELLFSFIKCLCPQLERKKKQNQFYVSCDVDIPFDKGVKNFFTLAKSVGGDILKRKNLLLASKRLINSVVGRKENYKFDPNYTFDWYMDICEKYGIKATFYFICDHSAGSIDGDYSLAENKIQSLMKRIHQRGHYLGVHGSYNTYKNREQIFKERQLMIETCKVLGIEQEIIGNRQHYLRWDPFITSDYLDDAGYQYDSTGSFADHPGFRYGTAHEFSMWSWQKRAKLKLKQRPLIVMEGTLFSYLKLGYTKDTLKYVLSLKNNALKYNGNFCLLWHNSHFLAGKDRIFFKNILKNNY